jgi:hypothetical protein
MDPELTGYVNVEGRFRILASRTGEQLCEGVATDHEREGAAKSDLVEPSLLADSERFYLFLNRAPQNFWNSTSSGMVRTQKVNGPAYAFERTTGRRLWFSERLFENQSIVIDRFDELPALVAAATVQDQPGVVEHRVVVVDKQGGRVKLLARATSGQPFQNIASDPRTRIVELWRNDFKVRIVPDDEPRQ